MSIFNIRFRKDANANTIKAQHLHRGDMGTVDGVPAVIVSLDGDLAVKLLDGQITPASTQRPADGRSFKTHKNGYRKFRSMQEQ